MVDDFVFCDKWKTNHLDARICQLHLFKFKANYVDESETYECRSIAFNLTIRR